MRATPTIAGIVLAMAVSAVGLVGCSPASDVRSEPAEAEPPIVSPEDFMTPTPEAFNISDCVVAPAGVLGAMDEVLVNADDSVPFAGSWYDEETKLWIMVGKIAGPASAGEDVWGVWGTKSDITSDPFDGELWALGGNEVIFSTAPVSDLYVFERQPRLAAAHKCYPVLLDEAGK
jgi:hypothetical protein